MLLETVETELMVVDGQKTAAEARAADGEASVKASAPTFKLSLMAVSCGRPRVLLCMLLPIAKYVGRDFVSAHQ